MVIAFSLLISGTISNSRSRQNCGISNHNQLSIGGILCFVHGLFAVSYYISATAVIQEGKKLKHPATAGAAANAWKDLKTIQFVFCLQFKCYWFVIILQEACCNVLSSFFLLSFQIGSCWCLRRICYKVGVHYLSEAKKFSGTIVFCRFA